MRGIRTIRAIRFSVLLVGLLAVATVTAASGCCDGCQNLWKSKAEPRPDPTLSQQPAGSRMGMTQQLGSPNAATINPAMNGMNGANGSGVNNGTSGANQTQNGGWGPATGQFQDQSSHPTPERIRGGIY